MTTTITTEELLEAYASGYFPMAESATAAELYWFCPEERGMIPLDKGFNIPHGLKKTLKQNPFTLKTDTAFEQVIHACATVGKDRDTTWINQEILSLYNSLHMQGHAHSIECWQESELVGGLYGVSIGGAFFGESMFSQVSNASKVALVWLVHILRDAGYTLLDTQYVNDHLLQFGCVGISKAHYMRNLRSALKLSPSPSSRFSSSAERISAMSSSNSK